LTIRDRVKVDEIEEDSSLEIGDEEDMDVSETESRKTYGDENMILKVPGSVINKTMAITNNNIPRNRTRPMLAHLSNTILSPSRQIKNAFFMFSPPRHSVVSKQISIM